MDISLPELTEDVDTDPRPDREQTDTPEPTEPATIDPDPGHLLPAQYPGDGAPWRAGLR